MVNHEMGAHPTHSMNPSFLSVFNSILPDTANRDYPVRCPVTTQKYDPVHALTTPFLDCPNNPVMIFAVGEFLSVNSFCDGVVPV